jgi:hypothetical protein
MRTFALILSIAVLAGTSAAKASPDSVFSVIRRNGL